MDTKTSLTYDAEGSLLIGLRHENRRDNIDDADCAWGERLHELEGEKLSGVWVIWDDASGDWFYDAPVLLRLETADVLIESVSGLSINIAFEHVELANKVTLFGSDADGHERYDSLYYLSWRKYELSEVDEKGVDLFYWRADDAGHPLALGCIMSNGRHLRVGDSGDITTPCVVNPLVADDLTAFDDVVLPARYAKPWHGIPKVQDLFDLDISTRHYRTLKLDHSWIPNGCVKGANRKKIFVGGMLLNDLYISMRPNRFDVLATDTPTEAVPSDFLLGKLIQEI